MRYLISLLLCLVLLDLHAQQKINIFHVVDSLTGKAVPSVSIVIVRAKLAISTEKDGIFSIPGDLNSMRDTVVIDAQSYIPYKILIHQMQGIDSIRLSKFQHQAVAINLMDRQEKELNKFKRSDVAYYAGLHTETANFDYLQLAQQFYLTKAGAYLKEINISRLAFNLNYDYQPDAVGMEPTKFRLRIYDADTVRGGPGDELCDPVVEIKNKDNQYLGISLSEYKIVIPGKFFFVAVEWIRDFYNQGYVMVTEKSGRTVQMINFRPAIGIHPIKGGKLNIWGLNVKKHWEPYTYFSPDFTDLAISAVVLQ